MNQAEIREVRRFSYENPRPDVQALVPREATRILDVGCASGAVGAGLKARAAGPVEVVGVEYDAAYADVARGRLDHVLTGDVAGLIDSGEIAELGPYDCIVCADILEHLVDPWAVLRGLTAQLQPGGAVIVSLPNVRHWRTFFELGVKGSWPRHPDGIYDLTHLRWFAARDAIELLRQAGLTVTGVHHNMRVRAHPSRWDAAAQRWAPAIPLLRGFTTFQYLLEGRKPWHSR